MGREPAGSCLAPPAAMRPRGCGGRLHALGSWWRGQWLRGLRFARAQPSFAPSHRGGVGSAKGAHLLGCAWHSAGHGIECGAVRGGVAIRPFAQDCNAPLSPRGPPSERPAQVPVSIQVFADPALPIRSCWLQVSIMVLMRLHGGTPHV